MTIFDKIGITSTTIGILLLVLSVYLEEIRKPVESNLSKVWGTLLWGIGTLMFFQQAIDKVTK